VLSDENEAARRDAPPFVFEDVWPEDEPLPLTDAECARLVRGLPVRWRGTLTQALRLPGRYELAGGWLYARRG
jgi:hypothetical protein